MNIWIFGMKGYRTQWNSMIQSAYAAKVDQAAHNNTKAQLAKSRRSNGGSKSQPVDRENIATLKKMRADILAAALAK